jgi:hypothetical protein
VAEPDEVDWWPTVAPVRKRVVVVGAGVAGLEAAWIAAARGHETTLFCAAAEPGGKTRMHASLPGGEHLSSIYDFQQLAAKKTALRIERGWRAAPGDVLVLRPHAVVLATGSEMSWPESLPRQIRDAGAVLSLREAIAALANRREFQGGTALIFDADHTEGTYAAAEHLQRLFDRVIVATPRERIAQDVPLVTQLAIYRRFNQKRIGMMPFVELDADSDWESGRVRLRNVYNGDRTEIDGVSLVCYSTPRRPNLELWGPLKAAGIDVRRIGDCLIPRTALAATAEGHAAGNAL